MKIHRVQLKNVRCFEHLDLRLHGGSALIVGDNGDGKSTVLRSIAIGLCDESSAAALFRELPGDFIRHSSRKQSATISIELSRDGVAHSEYEIRTTIKELKAFEKVEQETFDISKPRRKKIKETNFPWEDIFASGYGPGIRVEGSADYEAYQTVDAVYPLFKYDAPLHNPELIVRRILDREQTKPQLGRGSRKAVLGDIHGLLKHLLQLDPSREIRLGDSGIEVTDRFGRVEDLRSMGDGHRATVTWVLDILAWWFVAGNKGTSYDGGASINGIVLTDEIEQHLHPLWQRNIMRLLHESFPKVQFIATTHSPLVASGVKHIPVHRFDHGKHTITDPFGLLAEDVYQMMGLSSSRATSVEKDIEEFRALASRSLQKELSPGDQKRMDILRTSIRELSGYDSVELTAELDSIFDTLQKRQFKTKHRDEK